MKCMEHCAIKVWLVIVLSLLLLCQTALADVLYLKDGSVLYGRVVSQDSSRITFQTSTGTYTYSLSTVKSIEYGESASTSSQERSSAQVIVEQKQEQSLFGGGALTIEQQWNNALYLAYWNLAKAQEWPWSIFWNLVLFGGLAGLCSWGMTVAWEYDFPEAQQTLQVLGISCLVIGGVLAAIDLVTGPRKVQTWRTEIARLKPIGQQKGWVYLGRYIPEPDNSINVYVSQQAEKQTEWPYLLGTLLRGLLGD